MNTRIIIKKALVLALALLILAAQLALPACGGKGKKTGEYKLSDPALRSAGKTEGHDRVFYEIFVGSFSDSNGDGVGDLRGIINRMDYLNDGDPDSGLSLGVEGLWLTPIFKSPTYHKYDVTDYYTVDPQFGTEEDLKELVKICHDRNVLLILDLPINHTGRQNQWFAAFRTAHQQNDTSSEYYDFYTWYDADKTSAPGGRTFRQLTGTNHYVECNFSGDMPELNFDSDFVRKSVLDVAKHYLDMGIDGFRFDAAKYVYLGEHNRSAEFWQWYMDELRSVKPDVYAVAEVWDSDGITDVYYKTFDCFDFTISQSGGLIAETAKKGDVNKYTAYVEGYVAKTSQLREAAKITPFISNHDTDRAAGFLSVASGMMQMAANLYILGPGTPFIYYGEELGMRGSRGGANTDANRRLAMLWGDGDTVKDPAGSTYGAENQVEYTAKDQLENGTSLYNYYKKLLMIRRAYPAIAKGEYTSLGLKDTKLGGFTSSYEGKTVTVLHNTSGSSVKIDLNSIPGLGGAELLTFIGMEEASLNGTELTIGGQTSVVLG